MYDIIYIGGGLNYAGAVIASRSGLKVALIEKSLSKLGGVCLHKGCIPSKMFLHYAQTLHQSRSDIFEGDLSLNMNLLYERKSKLVSQATKAITAQCSKIDLIEGEGSVVASHTVEVNGKKIEAKYIVIGTGSSPFIPDGIDYNSIDIITSDEVLDLKTLPKEIAIYGDGAIGLEMASFFSACGVKTTLISRKKGLLKKAHQLIQNSLQKQHLNLGVIHLENHPISKATSTKRGVHIVFEDGNSKYFEKLLVATGRHPNCGVIATNLIKIDRGIVTDEHFETTLKNHYAIGDCNGKIQLAHAARAEVLYVTQKILGKKPRLIDLNHVVRFIHMLPMGYATVGQNRVMLEKEKIEFKESIVPLSHFTLSNVYDASEGSVILYIDMEGFILGAEIFAPLAEELISSISMAIAGEMDTSLAKSTIMAHPTFSEAVQKAYFRL